MPKDDKKMNERPSLEMMRMLVKLAKHLPAKSLAAAADAAKSKPNSFKRHLANFEKFYGTFFLWQNTRTNEYEPSDAGKQFVVIAEEAIRLQGSLRSWPPAHEIVIGATPRTAVAHLPSFLAEYAESVGRAGQRLPQITVREADSLETLWKRLQRGQTDFALRGLPVDAAGIPKDVPQPGTDYFAVSDVYQPVLLSHGGPTTPVSIRELLLGRPVGVLTINLDDVVTSLRVEDPEFSLPRPGLFVCENNMALMALVERGVCAGLVVLPAGFKVRKPLVTRPVTDIGWMVQIFAFISRNRIRSPKSSDKLLQPKGWTRKDYLERLEAVFRDPAVQREAMAPAYREVPFV